MKKVLLAIVALGSAVSASAQAPCTELFFSEIVEGSGNNKAIEIYNPTANPIALSNYRIVRYSNGNTAGSDSLQLTGTIGAYDVWVVVNGQTTSQPNSPACDTALQNMADQLGGAYPDPLYANGDDAIILARVSPYAIIDIFGKIGEDPGVCWTDVFPYTSGQGAWWTANHSLVRKSTVTMGVTTNPTAFNPTVEYDSLPENTWTNLGIHTSTCSASGIFEAGKTSTVNVFPNPSTGAFTVKSVSGIVLVEAYNALGELVYSKRCNGAAELPVDLGAQSAGLYYLQVTLDSGKRTTSKISIR